MPAIEIVTAARSLQGFKFFWMKTVTGFDPTVHCARCLKGSYQKLVGVRMPVNERVVLFAGAGDILYLCGGSAPYRWANNLHAALRVAPGHTATINAYTGDQITLSDCELIPFDDRDARRQFPHLPAEFLTCRNFQFGAHHFQ